MAALCAQACGDPEVVYQDRPVEFDGQGDRSVEAGLSLGQYIDGEFVPIGDGDEVPIINGFQGGTWVHLSIRLSGLPADGLVEAQLGPISEVRYGLKLVRTSEGYLEAYDIPLPVRMTEEELNQTYGTEVTLSASFAAGGDEVGAANQVILVAEE